jgi:hypothetical protein
LEGTPIQPQLLQRLQIPHDIRELRIGEADGEW